MPRSKQPLTRRICPYRTSNAKTQEISARDVYLMYARSNPLEAAQILLWLIEFDTPNFIPVPPGWEEVISYRSDCPMRCDCRMPHYDTCYARNADGREPDPFVESHFDEHPSWAFWAFDGELVADTIKQAWLAYANDAMATSLFDVAAQAQSETEMAYLRANADESVAHRVMAVQLAHAERPWVAFAATLGDANSD